MAKKKVVTRGQHASLPRRLKKQTRRAAERVLKSGPIRKRPRDIPLPGLEDARIGPLDDIAASISEVRASMNDLRTTEAGYMQNALNLMRQHDKTAWRAHGVELVRVPGEEKLRVRTSKDQATAETVEETDDEPGDVFAEDAGLDAESIQR